MTTCYASFENNELKIGNNLIERRWLLEGDSLKAVSLFDKESNFEWLQDSSPALTCPAAINKTVDNPVFTTTESKLTPVGEKCLSACLTIPTEEEEVTYYFSIVPDNGFIMQRLTASSAEQYKEEADDGSQPTGVEVDPADSASKENDRDVMEGLRLSPHHLLLHQVEMSDQTDNHDNLINFREFRMSVLEQLSLKGCVFAVEDVLTGNGIIFVKHAPLPDVRPEKTPQDCSSRERDLIIYSHGCSSEGEGYPWSTVLFAGGIKGITKALQNMQRCHRIYKEGIDGIALSNTWGDRNRDGCIAEDFMLKEIEVAAQLGIDVCQIDDGWEKGITANSMYAAEKNGVWEGFYASDPDYWNIDSERLPNGLEPLTSAVEKNKMGLGLWFGPDSFDDFANYKKDIDTVVEFYKKYNVKWVKIDGVKARTRLGELRLEEFFHSVLEKTNGEIVFDLDITAEVRPGYWGRCEVGPLFVENRYTDWHRWWPHNTFRNLWQLSHVINPSRLRMEWLNPERNLEKYEGDPLAPNTWDPAYTFATIMVASPLIWCELSNLSQKVCNAVGPIIKTWKKHRTELHNATVYPIGDAPTGANWSGFFCSSENSKHLLFFREENQSDTFTFKLPETISADNLETIAGSGECVVVDDEVKVTIGEKRAFLWVRV